MNDSDILGSRQAIFAWLWLLIGMVFCVVVVGGVTLTVQAVDRRVGADHGRAAPLNRRLAVGVREKPPAVSVPHPHPDMTLGNSGHLLLKYVHRLGRLIAWCSCCRSCGSGCAAA
jgi:hypothetical protein